MSTSSKTNQQNAVAASDQAAASQAMSLRNVQWDPLKCPDETPSPQCLHRLRREIVEIYNDPPPGMFILPSETDISKIHALITGPFDTPYEGGFFHFYIRCPANYPMSPPMVRLMTTGGGTVRFNPNLYRDGKVCLSILGTWTGPAWSPASTISAMLMSIQSLMNDQPYYNEPGFQNEAHPGDAQAYNDIIQHETIRVAVCDQIDLPGTFMPKEFVSCIESSFADYYEQYVRVCQKNFVRDGQIMRDPFGESRGKFDYRTLLKRIELINTRLSGSSSNCSTSPCQQAACSSASSGGCS